MTLRTKPIYAVDFNNNVRGVTRWLRRYSYLHHALRRVCDRHNWNGMTGGMVLELVSEELGSRSSQCSLRAYLVGSATSAGCHVTTAPRWPASCMC